MKSVYFDTNIYSHIRNRQYGITDGDVAKLFAKIRADKVRVYLSGTLLEETVSALLSNEREAIDRLRLIHRIAKRKRILKDYKEILESIFNAYIQDVSVGSYFQSAPHFLQSVMRNQNARTLSGLRSLAKESQQQIQDRKTSTTKLFDKKIWPLVEQAKQEGQRQSFEDYRKEHTKSIIEIFATLSGVLSAVQAKGVDGLFRFTPLRALTTGILSQGYANTYEKTAINRGDSRDLHHVVYAAAVGTLVTHDDKFAAIMRRVPITGFEVTDFQTLLEQV